MISDVVGPGTAQHLRASACPSGVANSEVADADLLSAIAVGQPDGLDALYDRYGTVAFSVAYGIMAERSAAEDVVQEAFLSVWRHAAGFAVQRGSAKTWLLSIVHHRAIDEIRKRRPSVPLPDREDAGPRSLRTESIWPEVAARLDAEAVQSALKSLPDIQRKPLELAYFGGLTQREIATRTGTPLGTVKSRMRLGLFTLRRALVDEAVD